MICYHLSVYRRTSIHMTCSDDCLWKGNEHVLIGSNDKKMEGTRRWLKAMAKGTKTYSSDLDLSALFLSTQCQDLLAHRATVTEASTA